MFIALATKRAEGVAAPCTNYTLHLALESQQCRVYEWLRDLDLRRA